MAKNGRPPKPTRTKKAEGNRGKRPLNESDLAREPVDPDCPEHLSPEAKVIFAYLVRELRADGIFQRVDSVQLGNLAQAYAIQIEAQTMFNNMTRFERMFMKTPSGYPMPNPLLGIIHSQGKIIDSIAAGFGMDPAARARLKIDPPPPGADGPRGPMDDLERELAVNGPAAAALIN